MKNQRSKQAGYYPIREELVTSLKKDSREATIELLTRVWEGIIATIDQFDRRGLFQEAYSDPALSVKAIATMTVAAVRHKTELNKRVSAKREFVVAANDLLLLWKARNGVAPKSVRVERPRRSDEEAYGCDQRGRSQRLRYFENRDRLTPQKGAGKNYLVRELFISAVGNEITLANIKKILGQRKK